MEAASCIVLCVFALEQSVISYSKATRGPTPLTQLFEHRYPTTDVSPRCQTRSQTPTHQSRIKPVTRKPTTDSNSGPMVTCPSPSHPQLISSHRPMPTTTSDDVRFLPQAGSSKVRCSTQFWLFVITVQAPFHRRLIILHLIYDANCHICSYAFIAEPWMNATQKSSITVVDYCHSKSDIKTVDFGWSNLLEISICVMKHSTREVANRISRALINASNHSIPPQTWTPLLEQTLHGLGCRDSLNSTLVSRVIDPFLIHHHSLALGFFDWASQQPGFTHTPLSYQSILKSLSISRQFTAIDRLMKQTKTLKIQLNASVYRSIIASHVAAKKPLHAFSVYTNVRCDIDADTTNSLLASLSSAGNMGHAHQVFDDIISRGVGLSTLGLGVFLWRFCATAELDKTLSLLDDVIRQDQGVNGSIIALLVVHGLCLASRAQEAMYMLDVLRKRDCKPDFMAYRVVAEALRATGDVVHVEHVLKMKRKLGVAPRSNDYRDFIFQLISERLICEAKDLGEVIVAGNFPIEDDVLNALIGSVSAHDPCSALMFFKFLIAKERFPTLLTFGNLGRNLCKHGNHDELLEVSKILSAKEYFVDLERYNIMVSLFCKAGKVKEAYMVLQEMKKKGLGPDISSYNYVMEGCCKEDMIRPAKRLWDEMFANGCEPSLKTYNMLIAKFSEIGQVKEAHMLFGRMLERSVQPDETTYDLLIKGFCQENQLEASIEVFKKSFQHDSDIAKTLLEKFILHLCNKGKFIAASNLVHDYTSTIGESKSNIILLKCLADAEDVSMINEHLKKIGEISVPLLHEIRGELLSSLSSSSKRQIILETIDGVLETLPISK